MPFLLSLLLPSLTASRPQSVCCPCLISLPASCRGVYGSGVNNADARLNTRTADTVRPMGYS